MRAHVGSPQGLHSVCSTELCHWGEHLSAEKSEVSLTCDCKSLTKAFTFGALRARADM